jgi:cytochrome c oxidase subunit 4
MAHTKLYSGIYVVLFVLATVQAILEGIGGLEYWTAFAIIMVLSFAKAYFVMAYYMHLRWEPRSLSYLTMGGLFVVLALTAAAAYSIL